jgi:hypothetical protein
MGFEPNLAFESQSYSSQVELVLIIKKGDMEELNSRYDCPRAGLYHLTNIPNVLEVPNT